MDRKTLWHVLYWMAAMLLVLTLQNWLGSGQTQLVPYSAFEQASVAVGEAP